MYSTTRLAFCRVRFDQIAHPAIPIDEVVDRLKLVMRDRVSDQRVNLVGLMGRVSWSQRLLLAASPSKLQRHLFSKC